MSFHHPPLATSPWPPHSARARPPARAQTTEVAGCGRAARLIATDTVRGPSSATPSSCMQGTDSRRLLHGGRVVVRCRRGRGARLAGLHVCLRACVRAQTQGGGGKGEGRGVVFCLSVRRTPVRWKRFSAPGTRDAPAPAAATFVFSTVTWPLCPLAAMAGGRPAGPNACL